MPLDANTVKKVGAAGLIAIALLTKPFEGERLKAFFDPPGIATICDGHTKGVKITDVATPGQCEVWLGDDIAEDEKAVDRLVKVKISDKTRAAFIDFVYNAGSGNFARSTMLKKVNAGDIAGACNQFPRWVYDQKGQKLRGLIRRREAEKKLCLEGLKP